MSLFEVDVDALQVLANNLLGADESLSTFVTMLTSANNQFEGSFVSPDKGQFEVNFQETIKSLNQAKAKSDEIRATLNNLLAFIQQAGQLSF